MVGSWSKRAALLTVMTMLFFLWPPAAEEADILAAGRSELEAGASARTAEDAEAASTAKAPIEAAPTGAETSADTRPAAEPHTPEPADAADDRPGAEEEAPEPAFDPAQAYRLLAAGDRTGGAEPNDSQYAVPEAPTVYLTFDDGPTKWTPQVLDILKEYGVPATFFVLGQLAEGQEDTIRRIVDEGHALGNHTYNHKYDELYGSFGNFWEQVKRTDDILRSITGQSVRLLRAPGGTATNFDAFYFYYLEQAGYRVHDWTVDSGDSKRRNVPAEEIVRNVKRSKLTHEVNVLLHDGAGHGQSVKALPEIIEYYQEKGYRFAALDERVKPASFRVGKVKWARSIDEDAFLTTLTAIASDRAQSVFAYADRSLAAAALSAKAGEPAPQDEWMALREWAADKGAVVWDASTETASVELEEGLLRFRVRTGEVVRLDGAGGEEAVDLAFKLEREHIRVLAASADAWLSTR